MNTAREMLDFCKKNNYGSGFSDSWTLKHFGVIEKSLGTDESVIMCFAGLQNYISMTTHDNNFAYAITNKRIIMGQKKLVGEALQSVYLDSLNDITCNTGILFGVITIDTIKEKFNVRVEKEQANNINAEIHGLLHKLKNIQKPSLATAVAVDPVAELKRYKELLDSEIITKDDFNAKKKQLLGL